jgi:hypothetical protein
MVLLVFTYCSLQFHAAVAVNARSSSTFMLCQLWLAAVNAVATVLMASWQCEAMLSLALLLGFASRRCRSVATVAEAATAKALIAARLMHNEIQYSACAFLLSCMYKQSLHSSPCIKTNTYTLLLLPLRTL